MGASGLGQVPDPVRLDVFKHLFAAVAEEMGVSLQRSSFSPNIRERRDFSCALFDQAGRMIGQASHLPVHLGSTPMSVAAAIAALQMGPGDAVLLNDPYAGGTHLPDLTLVSPVYLPGSQAPDFYVANRAHHADVGGAEPGSMSATFDVHGEGLRIPPLCLVKSGALREDVLGLILANMRVPHERRGDLLAQWATNRVGEKRLLEMAAEHGGPELLQRGAELMDWTERLTREVLRAMPDGRWSFEDILQGDADERLESQARLCVSLEKRGEHLLCDFSASDARPNSSLNATRAVTVSAVFYVLRLFLPSFTPTNDGILRVVEIRTRAGSLADASYPMCVAAGNVETSQRLVDVLLGAFGQALAPHAPAASAGTMSNLTFGGPLAESSAELQPLAQPAFAYYETIAGGAGAGEHAPGAHALQTHMTNTRSTPIEEFELAYPVRLSACSVRRGSGGAGLQPGGDGIRKRFVFLERCHVSFTGDRQGIGPWGRAGGRAGALGELRMRASAQSPWVSLGARVSKVFPAGSELEICTPGGGGSGTPDGIAAN